MQIKFHTQIIYPFLILRPYKHLKELHGGLKPLYDGNMKPKFNPSFLLPSENECLEILNEHFGDDPTYLWALETLESEFKALAKFNGAKTTFGSGSAALLFLSLITGGYLQRAIRETKRMRGDYE